jgi:hypothetical protein
MAGGVVLIVEPHCPLGVEVGRLCLFEEMHILILASLAGRIRIGESGQIQTATVRAFAKGCEYCETLEIARV